MPHPQLIVFTRGVPPPESFPIEQLTLCFDVALREDPVTSLQYGKLPLFCGHPALLQALAREYGSQETEILVGNGSLQLLDLLAQHFVHVGDVVLVEQPCYDRALTIFRRRGAKAIGIPLEEDGLSIERLEHAAKTHSSPLLYLVPDFQNPAGITLSLEKRLAVVRLAEKYGFHVIEDIPYRKLRYQGQEQPLLREFDPKRVITLGSFSKIVCPGVRIGFMIATMDIVLAVAKIGEDTYLTSVTPTQAAVAEFINRGLVEPTVERLKALYRPRWESILRAVKQHFPEADVFLPDGGFFLSMLLTRTCNYKNIVERARGYGLILSPGEPFMADTEDGEHVDGERFVRIAFQAVSQEDIQIGMKRLAELL